MLIVEIPLQIYFVIKYSYYRFCKENDVTKGH